MPCDHGRGLENYQRIAHAGHQPKERGEHQPIDVAEDKALRRLAPQHIQLMTKDENFGVQRSAGPEQPSHNAPDQPAEIHYRTEYRPIRLQAPNALSLR
jgi:hypothetical protein